MLLGPNHTQPAKADFVGVFTPFPRQGGPPEKKYHSESGLNQRDRATCGFVQCQTNRKPGKKNRRPGLSRASAVLKSQGRRKPVPWETRPSCFSLPASKDSCFGLPASRFRTNAPRGRLRETSVVRSPLVLFPGSSTYTSRTPPAVEFVWWGGVACSGLFHG